MGLREIDDARAATLVVLVVEDEVLIRMVISEALRDVGYAVVEAATADEAEALLVAGLHTDLMITDVRMPGRLDGLDLARLAAALRPGLPIAVTSGHLSAVAAELPGVVAAFLPKPFRTAELLALVDRLLPARP
jgi:DNA-binding NtrC family response regulator